MIKKISTSIYSFKDLIENNCIYVDKTKVHNEDPTLLFGELIETLYQKDKVGVVVLIDEYDKPIMEHLENEEEAESFRGFIETFFQMIKGYEQYERFVFMTGVIKFAKLSIFSKLNSLTDISMDRREIFLLR